MLVYFHYLDENTRWVIDCNGNDNFLEDYQSCGQPVDVPVLWSYRERVIFIIPLYLCEDCINIHDVINTCDGTFYNLSAYVCD